MIELVYFLNNFELLFKVDTDEENTRQLAQSIEYLLKHEYLLFDIKDLIPTNNELQQILSDEMFQYINKSDLTNQAEKFTIKVS